MDIPRFECREAPSTLGATLDEHGVAIVENVVGRSEIADLRALLQPLVRSAPLGNNSFDGYNTRRIFDPLARTRVLDRLMLHPVVHAVIEETLPWSYQFGMTIVSEVLPGERAQVLHRDAAVYPLPPDFPAVMVNAVWALDEFAAANGATLVVPGSHRDHETRTVVPAEMEAGSVLIYAGTILHGAGANVTDGPRLGLIVEHVARWLRPAECHPLAIGPDLAGQLPLQMQELLGFNQTSPYFGFVAGASPADWLARSRSPGEASR